MSFLKDEVSDDVEVSGLTDLNLDEIFEILEHECQKSKPTPGVDQSALIARGKELIQKLNPKTRRRRPLKRMKNLEYELPSPKSPANSYQSYSIDKANSGPSGDVVNALVEGLARSRLPCIEPEPFDGSPLQYPSWKAQVSLMLGSTPLSGAEKLHLVQRYLIGAAKSAILGLTLIPSEESYKEAMKTLDQRFGNKRAIAEQFRRQLESWPRIPNSRPEEIRKLSDFIKQCVTAQKTMRQLSVLDDPHVIDGIASKLPEWCYRMWKRKANGGDDEDEDDEDDYPDLESFSDFLAKEARIADHPLSFSQKKEDQRTDTRTSSPRQRREVRQSVVRATATEEERACLFCKKSNHAIQDCLELGKSEKKDIEEFSKKSRLCFRCGRPNHSARDCRKGEGRCSICGRNHATCFHGRYQDKTSTEGQATSRKVKTLSSDKELMSTVVPVYVSGSGTERKVLTYALLDSQSDTSFITDALAAELQADGTPTQLAISTMSTSVQHIRCRRFSNLTLTGLGQAETVTLKTAFTRRFIPATKSHIPTKEKLEVWPHLKKAAEETPSLLKIEVGLLIGYDCPDAMQPLESCERVKGAPFAFRTPLGWTALGRPRESSTTFLATTHRVALLKEMNEEEVCSVATTTAKERPALPSKDVNLQALDADISSVDEEATHSAKNGEFTSHHERQVDKQPDGEIVLPPPFRYIPPKGDRSREIVLSRREGPQRNVGRDAELQKEYNELPQGVISKGEAEEACDDNEGWRIPHMPVWQPSKKTLRVAFDCSVKSQGVGLNDHLMTGPDGMNALSGILMHFRDGKVAISCDIKMFHQFKVSPDDRKYLKFFWNGRTYQMRVHLFGAVASPACATFGPRYAVRKCVDSPECHEFFRDNFYVDDLLIITPDAETAIKAIGSPKEGLKKAEPALLKVLFNSEVVNEAVSNEELAREKAMLDSERTRALGIQWDRKEDSFSFKCPEELTSKTRHDLLSQSMSLFDPLCLMAPCILSGRQLLQETSKCPLAWDNPLPDDPVERWKGWIEGLRNSPKITIPRCYGNASSGRRELHVLTDASEKSYGACCYLREEDHTGKYEVSLITAKAEVQPKGLLTDLQLQLQAATTEIRQGKQVLAELKLPEDTPCIRWRDPPITPNLLLTGKSEVVIPYRESPEDVGVYSRQMWKRVLKITNDFWTKWKTDYLSNLRSRQKWKTPSQNIKKGDVVLVADDQAPREEWKMAVVTETKESADGFVRTATVRLATDKIDRRGMRLKQAPILTRPVQKLVLLIKA